MNDIELNYLLTLPPDEIVKYLESKGLRQTLNTGELWQIANNKAFTVAKALTDDLLTDMRAVLIDTIKRGGTARDFERALAPELRKKGWWGKSKLADIPGFKPENYPGEDPEKEVTTGSSNRLRVIYETNVSVAYNKSRFDSLIGNAKNRPYWQYNAVLDQRTRPQHASLNGKVYKYDDPIWNIIYPPNGWGCRCTVRALNERELKSEGLTVANGNEVDIEFVHPDWRYNVAL